MLQALLAERFALRTHAERREMPAYALVLARKDGALGPQMKKADVDCEALFAAVKAGGKMPPPGAERQSPVRTSACAPAQGIITGNAVAMEQLARNLTGGVGPDCRGQDRPHRLLRPQRDVHARARSAAAARCAQRRRRPIRRRRRCSPLCRNSSA